MLYSSVKPIAGGYVSVQSSYMGGDRDQESSDISQEDSPSIALDVVTFQRVCLRLLNSFTRSWKRQSRRYTGRASDANQDSPHPAHYRIWRDNIIHQSV